MTDPECCNPSIILLQISERWTNIVGKQTCNQTRLKNNYNPFDYKLYKWTAHAATYNNALYLNNRNINVSLVQLHQNDFQVMKNKTGFVFVCKIQIYNFVISHCHSEHKSVQDALKKGTGPKHHRPGG